MPIRTLVCVSLTLYIASFYARTMELETGECKEGNAIFKPKIRQRAVAVFDGYLTYASKLRPPLKSS